MKIHQLVPALHYADATGDSAVALRDYLRHRGFESDIYAYTIDEQVADEAIPFGKQTPQVGPEDALILHYAIPSGMTPYLISSNCKKAIVYHNITPAYYWIPFDSALVDLAFRGRKELADLAPNVHVAAGVSEYNRMELEQTGFKNTCVMPLYIKFERYKIEPSPAILRDREPDFFYFLCVGRVAPNKKLEDALRLLFFYRRLYSPLARLIIVGKTGITPSYYAALKEMITHYGLLPEDVVFAGHTDWPELVAYYKTCDALISMSEHEGFCVPLVEAMICNTPIVAYASSAIPFVLDGAGIQFDQKNYAAIAGICHRLKKDPAFRESILQRQQKRLQAYSPEQIEKSIEQFLASLLAC